MGTKLSIIRPTLAAVGAIRFEDRFCASRKGGTGVGGWVHHSGWQHMAAVGGGWVHRSGWQHMAAVGGGWVHRSGWQHMAAVAAGCRNLSPGQCRVGHLSAFLHKRAQKTLLSPCRDSISGILGRF